eukprot:Rmarinus@m.29289
MSTPTAVDNYFKKPTWEVDVPRALFEENCKKVSEQFQGAGAGEVVLLQGGEEIPMDSTDMNYPFRQESFFFYLFGVDEPGCTGVLHISTGKVYLFVPLYPDEYDWFMGPIPTLDEYRKKYDVAAAHYTKDLAHVLSELKIQKIHVLDGINTDSGHKTKKITFDGIDQFSVDSSRLHKVMVECRVLKSPYEMDALRYSNHVSSAAHVEIMRTIRPGHREREMEAVFKHFCLLRTDSRYTPYDCICGTGKGACTLHYVNNDKIIHDGEMALFDMGGEHRRYGADITCSFPVNGKFTSTQRAVYNAVYNATVAVEKALRPGVEWGEMHLLAEAEIVKGLLEIGVLQGDVDELVKSRVGATFFPHGLGHFLGLDTHDVGGYPVDGDRPRATEPGLKYLRTRRVVQSGMCLTVEPGCYFIHRLLEDARANEAISKFINWARADSDEIRFFGGIRIEDNVLVHENGIELMTRVPRTVDQIEACMSGKEWESLPSPSSEFYGEKLFDPNALVTPSLL